MNRQINPVQTPVDLQRAAKPPGTIDQYAIDFDRTNQHGGRKLLLFCDHIQTMVHAIDEINVRHTAPAEHDVGSTRSSLRRMAGLVTWADIGLNLNNPPGHLTPIKRSDKILADQRSSDLNGRSREVLLRENLAHMNPFANTLTPPPQNNIQQGRRKLDD